MSTTAPAPGSAEWLKYMTASKIAAVVGTSPYESRFSLWHRMAGNIAPQEQTEPMELGHVLEPALLSWFASKHPEYTVAPGQWEVHQFVEWAGATPDGYAIPDNSLNAAALVEAKVARNGWEWQADTIPPGYYDQCQWQMWVTEIPLTYVVALVDMQLVERVVEFDPKRCAELVAAARAFMASLVRGEQPALDGSMNTYEAVRELHPDISPEDVEVPTELAHRWLDARHEAARWATAEQQAKSEIAALMGDARRATWDGQTLFTRQARNGGTPYLVSGRNLPEIGSAA